MNELKSVSSSTSSSIEHLLGTSLDMDPQKS